MKKTYRERYAERVAQKVLGGMSKEKYGVALLELDTVQSEKMAVPLKKYGYDPYWMAEQTKDFVLEHFGERIANEEMQVAVLVRSGFRFKDSSYKNVLDEADYEYFRNLARRTFFGYRIFDERLKEIVPGYEGDESAAEVMVNLGGIIVIDLGWEEGKCYVHSFVNPDALLADDEVIDLLANVVERGDELGLFEDFWYDNY